MKNKVRKFKLLLMTLCFASLSLNAQTTAPIDVRLDPQESQQRLEGWGCSLCWWANVVGTWSDTNIKQMVDWLVSSKTLNNNLFRYNIGGGDDPSHLNTHMRSDAQMEGFWDGRDKEFDWTRDEAQRKIMLKIKELRPDAVFEAFSNSPPYWMTYSGCASGNSRSSNDNLKPEYYEDYCKYLVEVCKHYKETYGIEFQTLEPFNESQSNYWKSKGNQEGCHFDIATQIKIIKMLEPMLREAGLKTRIAAADESTLSQSLTGIKAYINDGGVLPLLLRYNTHTYYGSNLQKSNLASITAQQNIPLWMSEVGSGVMGPCGNLGLAQLQFNDLNYLFPNAWIDWQYTSPDAWGVMSSTEADHARNKNFYVREMVSRFIKAGYHLLSTNCEQVLASLSSQRDSVVFVVLNTTAKAQTFRFDLSGFNSTATRAALYTTTKSIDCAKQTSINVKNGVMEYKAPSYSISTFLLPVSCDDKQEKTFAEGKYYIIPKAGINLTLDVDEEVQQPYLRNQTTGKASQRWHFTANDKGAYQIINDEGMALTSGYGYYILTEAPDANNEYQWFTLQPSDNGCYFIQDKDGKVLDIEKEIVQPGSVVGIYEKGTTSNAHRQWRIMKCPNLEAAVALDPNDYTHYIVNPNIIQNKMETSQPAYGWEASSRKGGNGSYTKDIIGDTFMEYWGELDGTNAFNYYQTIYHLPTGYYRLQAYTFSNSTEGTELYATAKNNNTTTYTQKMVYNSSGSGTLYKTVVDSIYVANGTLIIGVRTNGTVNCNGNSSGSLWCGADEFTLTLLPDMTGITTPSNATDGQPLSIDVYTLEGKKIGSTQDVVQFMKQQPKNKLFILKMNYRKGTKCLKWTN